MVVSSFPNIFSLLYSRMNHQIDLCYNGPEGFLPYWYKPSTPTPSYMSIHTQTHTPCRVCLRLEGEDTLLINDR